LRLTAIIYNHTTFAGLPFFSRLCDPIELYNQKLTPVRVHPQRSNANIKTRL
jgi:hypothetical protein